MTKFRTLMTRIRRDEEGATAIEYGLLAALIAVVLILAFTYVGATLDETFTVVGDQLNTANQASGGAAVTK
jgi:pilus assembly protein Flp/PilA